MLYRQLLRHADRNNANLAVREQPRGRHPCACAAQRHRQQQPNAD